MPWTSPQNNWNTQKKVKKNVGKNEQISNFEVKKKIISSKGLVEIIETPNRNYFLLP